MRTRTVCESDAVEAVKGACPVHGGDNCLIVEHLDHPTLGQFHALKEHFDLCPLPPDAGCGQCHAYEKERRRRCHGSTERCAVVHRSQSKTATYADHDDAPDRNLLPAPLADGVSA